MTSKVILFVIFINKYLNVTYCFILTMMALIKDNKSYRCKLLT